MVSLFLHLVLSLTRLKISRRQKNNATGTGIKGSRWHLGFMNGRQLEEQEGRRPEFLVADALLPLLYMM